MDNVEDGEEERQNPLCFFVFYSRLHGLSLHCFWWLDGFLIFIPIVVITRDFLACWYPCLRVNVSPCLSWPSHRPIVYLSKYVCRIYISILHQNVQQKWKMRSWPSHANHLFFLLPLLFRSSLCPLHHHHHPSFFHLFFLFYQASFGDSTSTTLHTSIATDSSYTIQHQQQHQETTTHSISRRVTSTILLCFAPSWHVTISGSNKKVRFELDHQTFDSLWIGYSNDKKEIRRRSSPIQTTPLS